MFAQDMPVDTEPFIYYTPAWRAMPESDAQ